MSLGNPPAAAGGKVTAQQVADWLDASADWIAERTFTDLFPDPVRKRLERLAEVIDAKLAGFEADLACYGDGDLPSPSPTDLMAEDMMIVVRHEHVSVADVLAAGGLPEGAVGVEWIGRFQTCRRHVLSLIMTNNLANELLGHVMYDDMIPPHYAIDCAGCVVDLGVLSRSMG